MEDGPQLGDVGGEGDVRVEDDDPLQVGGQRLGQDQLHEAVDPRVVLVGDPRHLRLVENNQEVRISRPIAKRGLGGRGSKEDEPC